MLAGHVYLDPRLDRTVAAPAPTLPAGERPPRLSARERQILAELANGKPLVDIGSEMKLASSTVSTYKARLMEKLGHKSLSELVRYAIRHGLVD